MKNEALNNFSKPHSFIIHFICSLVIGCIYGMLWNKFFGKHINKFIERQFCICPIIK